MDALIELFEKDDVFWRADSSKSEGGLALSGEYSMLGNPNSSQCFNEIKNKLILILQGHALTGHEFANVINHLSLLKNLSKSQGGALSFVQCIRQLSGVLPGYTDSKEAWCEAKDLIDQYLCIQPDLIPCEIPGMDEDKLIAESILYLRKFGYEVNVRRGVAVMSLRSEAELLGRLKREFKKLGGHAVDMVLSVISEHYNFPMQRFFLRPEPSISTPYVRELPWGYLFNLALTELHQQRVVKNKIEIFARCAELCAHYFCIQRIQVFSKIQDSYHRPDTILAGVQRNISFDQHFSIDQLSSKHAIAVVKGIFGSPLLSKIEVDVKTYIEILEWVSSRASHAAPFHFSLARIYNELMGRVSLADLKDALATLTFSAESVNAQYLMPNDISKRNYFERPFIAYGTDFIYVNPAFCSYGFYSALLRLYQGKGVNGSLLGQVAEQFVYEALTSRGIKVLTNKTYKVPLYVRKELEIESKSRECDFIIESESAVYFVELKRKTLTSEARSGNQLKSLKDISQSFLHALVQAGIHEYTLRRDGILTFTDGGTVFLNGRDVIRVSLSMFGFFGIQDSFFINQMLSNLVGSQIQDPVDKVGQEVNEYLRNIQRQYQSEIFSSLYGHYANPFINCRFMSVPQLLEVLEDAKDNEQLHQQLEITRRSGTGCKDWFKDYEFLRGLLRGQKLNS